MKNHSKTIKQFFLLTPRRLQILSLFFLFAFFSCSREEPKASSPTGTNENAKGIGFRSPPKAAGDSSLYEPIVEPGIPVSLGFGVDINNQKGIPAQCLEGKVETVPMQEGMIALDADFTRDEIETSLGVNGSGGVKFLSWGASARASYVHKSRQSSIGLNYIVFAYNKSHSKVFIPGARTEGMKSLDGNAFFKNCGGAYVAAQDFGSMLIIKFSIFLDEKSEETNWGGGGSANYLSFAKLKADISRNSKSKKSSGKLSISALQVGGKPEALGKILKTDGEAGLIENFSLCDISKVDECLQGLRSIENYVSKDFPDQIQAKEGGGPAILSTYPFRYPDYLGGGHEPAVEAFVKKSRELLGKLYDDEMNDIALISDRIARKVESEEEDLGTTLEAAKKNVEDIRAAMDLCYKEESYKKCSTKAEELKARVAATIVPEIDDRSTNDAGVQSGKRVE